MPAFQEIINFPPSPDSLKSGADKINANFATAQNKGSGVFIIDPILPKAGLEYPTPPEFFLRNTTPSDIALARKVIMTLNGVKGDLSPIEQMRLEVFHPDSPFPDATQASLFLTVDALGQQEALRIYQHPTWYTAGLIQFAINPRPYLTDQSATLAVMSPRTDVPAKLKISTPEAGGGAPDGINFEVYRTAISLGFGTTGSLNIPRQGNGSGNIFFLPRGAGLGDYLGVNTTAPLNTWSVYDTTSPSMSLQTLYWDSNGPHSPAYDCRAIDGTLGAMGWEQLDYPGTPRKSRWFATASTGGVNPDIKIELEEGNLFFTAPGVTREGLRNEERLSKVTYINVIEDFPGYPGDIVFTDGIWDANDLPFTLTQDIYVNKGVTVRNLNITTGNYIEIGSAASTDPNIRIESSRITFTGSGRQGLVGGDNKDTAYAGFDLDFVDCDFTATAAGKFINLSSLVGGSLTANVRLIRCGFDGGCPGTITEFNDVQLIDLKIKNATGGFFISDVRTLVADNISNKDVSTGPGYVQLSVTEITSGAFPDRNVCLISGLTQRDGHLLYLQPTDTGTNPVRTWACISKNAIVPDGLYTDPIPPGLVKDATRIKYFDFNLTGYISEGQAITGSSS